MTALSLYNFIRCLMRNSVLWQACLAFIISLYFNLAMDFHRSNIFLAFLCLILYCFAFLGYQVEKIYLPNSYDGHASAMLYSRAINFTISFNCKPIRWICSKNLINKRLLVIAFLKISPKGESFLKEYVAKNRKFQGFQGLFTQWVYGFEL